MCARVLFDLPPFIGTVEVVGVATFPENTLLSDFVSYV
jgi:hypothetical protein